MPVQKMDQNNGWFCAMQSDNHPLLIEKKLQEYWNMEI
jgi:hypothetical protein